MNRERFREPLFTALLSVAPEVRREAIDTARPLREQVDLDSMDWLNFLLALRDKTGVSVDEADYWRLRSVEDLLDYIAARPQAKM